jgi:hypothetical protein
MDSRTLKRLFPFIAGGACTKVKANVTIHFLS